MKKIKIQSILTAVAGLFLATSCSSSFLDTEPTDAVSSDQVAVAGNAERLFNGAWYNLFEYGTTYANIGYRALQCQDDMMASDVVSRPKYGFNSSYQFNDVAIPSDGRTSFAWYLIYKTIDNCNTAISIKGDSEELRQAQGQALALRAFCYLHLVQHYQFTYLKDKDAPCVPIYTEPTTSSTEPKGKSTVAQVYQQIFDDLNLAQDYLTNYVRKGDGQKFKPNTDVVNGLLARAYLLTGQWGEAAKAAEAARKGYSLMTTTAEYEGFNNISNKEWIWGSPQTLSQSDASYNFYYLDATYVGAYSSFMADPHLMDTFVKGDIRLPLFQWMREGYLGYKKFHMRSDDTADLVLMRSAEMYLIEAASGTGKSSLCSYLYGYRNDYQGIINFDETNIKAYSVKQWVDLRKHSLSMLFQDLRIFTELTALENVQLKNNLTGYKKKKEILAFFEKLGLSDKLNVKAGKLSFGQQQRVAFIRALCQPFDFLFLDEPISHLDDDNSRIMGELIIGEAEKQQAGVIATSIGKHIELPYQRILQL